MQTRQDTPAAGIRPGSRFLTFLVLLAIALGATWVLRQADQLSAARRQLPAGCLQLLADMPPGQARTRGVPLRECARRKLPADRKATLVGHWSYGIEDAHVDGYIALVRQVQPDGLTRDRLIHVGIEDNYAVLRDFSTAGQGCAGGIDEAGVKDGVFTYVVNLTPEMMMRFAANSDIERIYRKGDLQDSPLYCAGKLSVSDRRPVLITLKDKPTTAIGEPVPEEKITTVPRDQACFTALVADYTSAGKNTLAYPDEYVVFLSDYISRCTDGLPAAAPAKAAPAKKKQPRAKRRHGKSHFTQRYY